MTAWMHVLVSLLGGGILLGLGLAKSRRISPPAGYLFAGAGVLVPMTACCTTVLFYTEASHAEGAAQALIALGGLGDFVAMLLVVAAFVVLSRATKSKPRS